MKICKKLPILLFFALLSCIGQTPQNYQEVTPQAFANKIESTENPQILDVRTPDEFAFEHLHKAVNINWNDDDFTAKAMQYDTSKPVFVYCLSGGRSKKAAKKLTELGFQKVYELEGGILKWKAEGLMENATKPTGMTLADFNKLLDTDKKVLVDFYAVWCGPCKKMEPYLLKMQKEMTDKVTVIRIDVDKNKTLATEMKIDQLPIVVLYENKEVKWKNVGYISEQDLKKKLQ
jgi:thioredoxin